MTPYYTDAHCQIFNGDCREILPTLGRFDLCLTDPPYASGARTDSNRQVRGAMLRSMEDEDWFSHDAMTTWGFQWFMRSVLIDLKPVMEDGAHLYWFTDWRMAPTVYGMMEAHGYRVNHCLTWAKDHFGMGCYWRNQHENICFASHGKPRPMAFQNRGSVLRFANVNSSDRKHPTEKPVELIAEIMTAAGGQTIIDPFMGSGTTLVAAKQLGRKAVGIELEERYCEIAAQRLSQQYLPLNTEPAPVAVQQEMLA